VRSEKRHPKPEYYVFVTNVELSSAAGGGKDKAEELVKSYYGQLPLKGHAVWDANQLITLLALRQELRRRFTEFLTPGDVLAAMLADLERKETNATHILTTFLERELRADEASRLDQAGNRTDEQLRLAQLFVDLPASTQAQLVPPEEQPDPAGRLPPGVLCEMLRDGSRKLDPMTLYEQETSSSEDVGTRFPARYVLLGGPGSGKSTLGQFLAQIHRSALLSRREQHLLEPQTRRIIEETRQLCDREGFPWPATPRYVFRVELNRFAKALASYDPDGIKSVAGYLLAGLKGEHALTREHVLEWLATYPSLLILDGLDEVPAASNRSDVVKAVDDLLSEARQMGADLFVVATSRQQGYAGEFSGGIVAIRHVLPLSSVRALHYVERYADARFGTSDPDKAKSVVDKLREGSKRQLTAQLMGSPLQVTFMATVVAARGDPGEDRWQLFDSYYRTIYDRERQKAVPPYDTILSKQQPTIDRLHHDIGFWLQYRGETAGGTTVSLPIDNFERLVLVYRDFLEGVYRDDLQLRIGQADMDRSLGAWPLLLRLSESGIGWASELLDEHWPPTLDRLMPLTQVLSGLTKLRCVRQRLSSFLPTISPVQAFPLLRFFPTTAGDSDLFGALCKLKFSAGLEVEVPLRFEEIREEGCSFRVVSIRQEGRIAADVYAKCSHMQTPHPGWLPLVLAGQFLKSPSPDSLATILSQCADGGWTPLDNADWASLPWPLAVSLHAAQSLDDLRSTVKRLRQGTLGTTEDWMAAEERWTTEGIALSDVAKSTEQSSPLDDLLGGNWIPTLAGWSITHRDYPDSFIRELFLTAQKMPLGRNRRALLWFLFRGASRNGRLTGRIEPSQLRALLDSDKHEALWAENCVGRPDAPKALASWLEFFEWLGRSDVLATHYNARGSGGKPLDDAWCESFQEAYVKGGTQRPAFRGFSRAEIPVKLGLLRMLGRLASAGYAIGSVPVEMLRLTASTEPRFRLAALLVRIAGPNMTADDAQQIANETVGLLAPPAEVGADHLVFQTVEAHFARSPAISEFLLHLRERMPAKTALGVANCERLLRQVVRRQASGLQSREELRRLQLPVVDGN